jgi:hypothetical protein
MLRAMSMNTSAKSPNTETTNRGVRQACLRGFQAR